MKKTTFRPTLEAFEGRLVPTTLVWQGEANNNWANPQNWSKLDGTHPPNPPGNGDVAVFSPENVFGRNNPCALSDTVLVNGLTMTAGYTQTINLNGKTLTTGGTGGTGGSDSIGGGLVQLHGGVFVEGGANNNWTAGTGLADDVGAGYLEIVQGLFVAPTGTMTWSAKVAVDALATLTYDGGNGGSLQLDGKGWVSSAGLVTLAAHGQNPFQVVALVTNSHAWDFTGSGSLDVSGAVKLTQDVTLHDNVTATLEPLSYMTAGTVALHDYAQLSLALGTPTATTTLAANVSLFDHAAFGTTGWTNSYYKAKLAGSLLQDGADTLVTLVPDSQNVYNYAPYLEVTGDYTMTAGTLDQTLYVPLTINPSPKPTFLTVDGAMTIGESTTYSVHYGGGLESGSAYSLTTVYGGYTGSFGLFDDHGGTASILYDETNHKWFGITA